MKHQEHLVDAAELIAHHLARTSYADLPTSVVAAVKASILDTLGCVLAGTASPAVNVISSMVREWRGAEIATLIGSGGVKLPPTNAVFANGAAIHQYDFDDVHDSFTCHPTASTFVPALAAAEEVGNVSGKELILAVALGNDLTCRVSRAVVGAHGHPWYRAPVVGMFGATAAAAKIFRATEQQYLDAFGLALPQVGGTYASLHHSGSSVRSIRDGLAYRNGLLSAELAMRGVKGDPEVFEGKYGFYQAYFKGDYNRDRLVGALGEDYETARISLKPWPSARHLHTTITAVLDIMNRQKLSFERIAEVIVDVGRVNGERCQPMSVEIQNNHIDLLSNLPFAVAAAIRHNNVRLDVYLDATLVDDVATNALPKVRWRNNSEQDGDWRFEPGRVEIRTVSGEAYNELCMIALGHPENPMTEWQRHDKFARCAAIARRRISDSAVGRIIEVVAGLENCPDIAVLMELIA